MRTMERGLLVTDWDGIGFGGKFWAIVAKLETAGADPQVTMDPPIVTARRKDGTTPKTASLIFDGNKVRDTWAHGWAVDAGYVAAITY